MTSLNFLYARRSTWVMAAIVAGISWLGTLIWIGERIGITGIAAGLVLALPISTALVLSFLWLDRWKPQGRDVLFSAFIWGATVTAIVGIGWQALLQFVAEGAFGYEAGQWIRPLIIAPLTEDTFKGVFLVWIFITHRRRITGVLDGIVIGGLIGVGFTFTENILYFGQMVLDLVNNAADPNAFAAFLSIFLLRGLVLAYFHALMGVLVGIGVGLAVRRRSTGAQVGVILAGFGAAWILHGIWDWAAIANADPEPFVATALITLILPSFIAAGIVAVVLRRRRGRLIRETLPALASSGQIPHEDVAPLSSLRERRLWRARARAQGGSEAARAVALYQSAASDLCILSAQPNPADPGVVDVLIRDVAVARERVGTR